MRTLSHSRAPPPFSVSRSEGRVGTDPLPFPRPVLRFRPSIHVLYEFPVKTPMSSSMTNASIREPYACVRRYAVFPAELRRRLRPGAAFPSSYVYGTRPRRMPEGTKFSRTDTRRENRFMAFFPPRASGACIKRTNRQWCQRARPTSWPVFPPPPAPRRCLPG